MVMMNNRHMAFKRPSAQLEALMDDLLGPYPIDKRRMFGCPAYFLQGNMLGGVFGDGVFLRLSDEGQREVLEGNDEISHFEPLKGKRMREYLWIPESAVGGLEELGGLIEESFFYVSSKPPKLK